MPLPPLPRPGPRLLLALAALLHGPAAFGQEDPRHDETKDLTAVVVRASPLARTAEDLTRPVEILAGERLDEAKANSLGETVARLPGVQASYFGPGVGRPVIRGLDGARVQVLSDGLGSGDASTLSVDHAVSIEPFLATQVEVLKGPATLLYGSGAIGGAVNVIDGRIPESATARPLEGRAELRAGSVNDEATGMVRLDGTSASGRFVFHADALHRETGDYAIPGFAETAALREAGHDAPDEGDRGRLANSFVRTDSAALGASYVGARGFLGIGASLFSTRYGIPGHAHASGEAHGDDLDDAGHGDPADEAAVRIAMEQRRHELRGGLDDLGPLQSLRLKLARTAYTHTEYEGDAVGTVFDNDTREARLELVHRPWGGWQGAFGLQHARRDFVAVGDEAFVPGSQSRDLGVFWMGERDFGRLALELGARHDHNRVEVDADAATGRSRTFDATSVSAAARWDLSPDLHLSLGLDRAQRSPGAEELYSSGLHVATQSVELGDPGLGIETANRGEVGVHWHAGPLRLGTSLYHVRYADFVYLADTGIVADGVPVRLWTQADAAFSGGELDAEWTFAEGDRGAWSVRSFADVVRGRLSGSGTREVAVSVPHGDQTETALGEVALGGNLPRIVPARVGLELRWRGGHWRAGVGAVRHARQDHVARFEQASDGYTLVHANLAWHLDLPSDHAVEVFVDGLNLLDAEARPHTSFLKDRAPLPGRGVAAGVRVFF